MKLPVGAAVIPFRPPVYLEQKKDMRRKEHFTKVRMRYSPDDPNSETYQVLSYKHANGGPVEFIELLRTYHQIKRAQNLTTGPACCRLLESLLRGAWLRIFKAEMLQRGSETVPHVNETLRLWGTRIYGPRPQQRQKWYLLQCRQSAEDAGRTHP